MIQVTIVENPTGSMKFLLSFISENAKELKESSAALFLSIFASAVAGAFLSNSKEMLLIIPGLIILIPGATNMRGAIFGAVGARLGSAFHLGQITSFSLKNDIVKTNVLSSVYLSVIFPVMLASLASLFSRLLGYKGATISTFITIAFIGSIVAGSILLVVTFFIAFTAYGRGWDPDNVTAPLIASIGDIITLPSLLFAAWLTLRFSRFSGYFSLAVIGLLMALVVSILLGGDSKTRTIVIQSAVVLSVTTLLNTLSGLLLQEKLVALIAIPSILVLLPAFLSQGGNIGSIFASRFSTKLHLGIIQEKGRGRIETIKEMLGAYTFALLIFPAVGVISIGISGFMGIPNILGAKLVLVSLFGGLIVTTIVVLASFYISIFFMRRSIDPDNVIVPIITSLADILGVVSLVIVLTLFGAV